MGAAQNRESAVNAAIENRKNVVLVLVENDAESHVTARLAALAGIHTVVLEASRMGVSLDNQPEAFEQIIQSGKKEVWLFELPGPVMEASLRGAGMKVVVIDHHWYADLRLDRTCDGEGNPLPSALEQFVALAGITPREVASWDFFPGLIRGIGLVDARFVRGLREAGYSPRQIADVMSFRDWIMERMEAEERKAGKHKKVTFAESRRKAALAWNARSRTERYWLVKAGGAVPGAVQYWMWRDDCDEDPLVVVAPDDKVHTARHVPWRVVEHIVQAFPGAKVFAFGTRNCVGVDNRHGHRHVTADEFLAALNTAPW